MQQVILWGTGKIAGRIIDKIEEKIVFVVDNDIKKWGTVWNGYMDFIPNRIYEKKNVESDFVRGLVRGYKEKG